jgi:uncharacterized protein YndB with AHSA1/START domain
MTATVTEQAIQAIEIVKEERIAAPIGIVFETILEQMGPLNEKHDGTPLPMKIEAWPGGRWFRDLGGNNGHLWAHVQSIKPPALLEFYGPLFMSAPAMSHVLYRLTQEGGVTLVKFSHRAVGQIPQPVDGMNEGWSSIISRIRKFAELESKETKR